MQKKVYIVVFFLINMSVFLQALNFDTNCIGKQVYLNDDRVRIRDNDSLESNCLSILQLGTVATIEKIGKQDVINSDTNNWIYIKVDESISGWVWGLYLSLPSDNLFERCKHISLFSFEDDDYQYFKDIGITRISEIIKFFTPDQVNNISKVHIDFSQNVDFENISLFTNINYLYIKNAESINTQYIPKKITRLILTNCSINTLDLSNFSNLEGLSLYSCKKDIKIIYPNHIDFVSFYDYSSWHEEIKKLPNSIRELYLCYNNITNFDFLQKLVKYPNLVSVCLAGNPIPEEKRLRGYEHFGIFYTDEY